MLKVGLTGGIGSGKSTVAAVFEVLGIPVYYADKSAKRIMSEDLHVKNAIIECFGPEAYKDGRPDRSWLAAHVFKNAENTSRINAIVHPATIADAEAWMSAQSGPYALKEAALIFESGGDRYLDLVIGVTAPMEIRINRVVKRDGIERSAILQRMARQMEEEEKMSHCRFVIQNDEQSAIIPQVLSIHQALVSLSTAI
jgi:dephospho-CoA kinase